MAEDIGISVGVRNDNTGYEHLKSNALESIFKYSQHSGVVNSLYYNDKISFERLIRYADSDKEIQSLRFKIREYKELTRYKWPSLKPNEYKMGQRSKDIAKLRWMLVSLGDIENRQLSAYREQIYDPSITSGIKQFQKRHGLSQSGNLTIESIELLNVRPKNIVTKLQSAVKAKLSVFHEKKSIYIEVNISEFKLRVKGDEDVHLEMPVIIGSTDNKTPLLNTYISNITVNPTWTPPYSIVYDELLLGLKNNPRFLDAQRFVLVDRVDNQKEKSLKGMSSEQVRLSLRKFRLVQTAGYWNALGAYRFTIPNSESIFLHDTPNRNLFFKSNRALSHGCIRLAKPEQLANYLISRENVDKKRILKIAKQGTETVSIRLKNPIPIIITNQYIWVDKDDLLQVRANVYNQEVKDNG
ncbi:cell wall degradation protein [Shewanella sp. c952]|nr:cell wall degradation protein [Shewanella sp. c952]